MILSKDEKESVRAFQNQANSLLPEGWEMVWGGPRRMGSVLMRGYDAIMHVDNQEILATPNSSLAKVVKAASAKKVVETNPEPKPVEPHTAEELKRKVKEAEAAIKEEMTALADMHDWSNLDVEVNMSTRLHRRGKPLTSISVRVKAEI